MDAAALENSAYRLDSTGLHLGPDDAVAVDPSMAMRGWIRRLAPEGWREEAGPSSHEGVVRASWYLLLATVIRSFGVEWLTALDQLADAENKALQQLIAARLGIATPETVITSCRELIPAELGERLVVKPLGPGSFAAAAGTQVVYANELTRDHAALDALGGAPFLVQERIAAERHLRVVTVRDSVWICELDAEALPLDWRRAEEAHDAFRLTDAFGIVAPEASRLAASLGVGYSSQDWLVSGEVAYFLDLNPGGQWLFLPDEVADPVTSAIAEWLVGR